MRQDHKKKKDKTQDCNKGGKGSNYSGYTITRFIGC